MMNVAHIVPGWRGSSQAIEIVIYNKEAHCTINSHLSTLFTLNQSEL